MLEGCQRDVHGVIHIGGIQRKQLPQPIGLSLLEAKSRSALESMHLGENISRSVRVWQVDTEERRAVRLVRGVSLLAPHGGCCGIFVLLYRC